MDVEQFLDQPLLGFFIDGKFKKPKNRKEEKLYSPLTKKTWKKLVFANSKDVNDAIVSAELAFQSWKKAAPLTKSSILRKIGKLIIEYKDVFAKVMATEMGKPITQGKA